MGRQRCKSSPTQASTIRTSSYGASKPLLVQGLVATTPPPQPNPNALGAPPTAETSVHHLLAMTTEEVNLQTRRNQYGTTSKPTDTSMTSTSKSVNAPLQLPPFPHPPYAKFPIMPRLELWSAIASWMIWPKHLWPCPLLRY